jgi:hypothetical protein
MAFEALKQKQRVIWGSGPCGAVDMSTGRSE